MRGYLPLALVGLACAMAGVITGAMAATNTILNISGTYPHLAVFGNDGEIGIGAVAPWAGKLWFITYPPHAPHGSPDKLWTVDTDLTLTARPESVGGTHANRMIHRETQQLIIGPYLIDTNAAVRTVSPSIMPGRLTATARHLTDPAHRVYFLTMEKGLYDVDVNTLSVTPVYGDGNATTASPRAPYPGTHGKGGYTGQGRLVYANNGEAGWTVARDPHLRGPAGVLTEHSGPNWSEPWTTLERKNFTEITGPGGIYGNTNPDDPVWALGWDRRSVLLKLLDHGTWSTFRLPKASYSHDALHGWFTEWPRIREITGGKLLMHMHGMFYYFPKTFGAAHTAGIQPICSYLKMPVDYCWWNNQLVISRDDASLTGGNRWAGQSNSGLWFGQLSDLETWGAPAGFGGPWQEDDAPANTTSDPFLVTGFQQRVLHLKHTTASAVTFVVQYDRDGTGAWHSFTNLNVPADGYSWCLLPPTLQAVWVRLTPTADATGVTARFILGNPSTAPAPSLFAGLAGVRANTTGSDGIIRAHTGDARTLEFAANLDDANPRGSQAAYYEIAGDFRLRRTTNAPAEAALRSAYSLAQAEFTLDAASVIHTEGTNRFRLPKSDSAYDAAFASGWPRGVREVVTERNLFNAHGTIYELPRADSGGFRRLRPVTTHNKRISDFTSWRGLFVMAGIASGAANDGHVFRSSDGQAALWFGNVDDLWRMGAPAGVGGPWKNSVVAARTPSDPYLMFGYREKEMQLSHTSDRPVTFTVEVDFTAENDWSEYARITVPVGQVVKHVFPDGYSAHWVRLRTDLDTTATATFIYGPRARLAANHEETPSL